MMDLKKLLRTIVLSPVLLAGMPPAAPEGPGPEDHEVPGAEHAEPVPSLAEVLLEDYAELTNREAVSFALDLGLMNAVDGGSGKLFAEKRPVTAAEVRAAVRGIEKLAVSGKISVPEGLFDGVRTRGELAKTLLQVLHDGTIPGLKISYNKPIRADNVDAVIADSYVFYSGGNAVEYSGTSNLVVRNSTIYGTTTKETKPLSGPPSGLTISGSIRTTLALKQAKGLFINSRVISRDWAVFATDSAVPVEGPGQKELTIYTYGTTGTALAGGYGTYSDLFCGANFYGSTLISPELGAVSGTFGTLAFDTIAAGEQEEYLSAYLTAADRAMQPNKALGSRVTAGRHAIMIHCVSLPPYWGRPGYSKTELPYHEGVVTVRHSVLSTDMSLDRHNEYPDQVPAYISHVAGSVILIRSCNARILLDDVQVKPDPAGTGAILHTAINSDLPFMVRVADGTVYPGTHMDILNSQLSGDILHEDYQRDLYLRLKDSTWNGKLFTGTVDSWNTGCRERHAENYIIDPDGYQTVHGSHVDIGANAVWTVTEDSSLNDLTISNGGRIKAPDGKVLRITVDDRAVEFHSGTISGDIKILVV